MRRILRCCSARWAFGVSRLRPHRRGPLAPSPELSFESLEARQMLAAWQPTDEMGDIAVSASVVAASSDSGDEIAAAVTIPRGRAVLNAEGTTFVADNGQLLRGPFASTEWGSPPPLANIQAIKNLGVNAIHLYGEVFNPNYVSGVNGPGDEPGYAVNRIDSMVSMTRNEGLYLVLTIGNGANNGMFNRDYVLDFWNFYAPRYADETHVLFEVQNEPHAWSAPYPQAALEMERDAYALIRGHAPDTPILLFSFAVLGSGPQALADINWVSSAASVDWTKTAVAFHGYAGWSSTATSVQAILNADYPVFMTEFTSSDWGENDDGLDTEMVWELERLKVSWLTFQHIPPNFINSAITDNDFFKDDVDQAGLGWTPDFGSWPVPRGVYGNGGVPRQTTGLTGTLRVEAEHFDTGGQGVAYNDADPANTGGQLRPTEGVDLVTTTDAGGGVNLASTVTGEWLDYTLFVTQPGYYTLRFRVAGAGGQARIVTNGDDVTGAWTIPPTAGDQTWTTISRQVFLDHGRQKLRLEILAGGFNLNWIELAPATSGQIATGTYKIINRNSGLAIESSAQTLIQNPYTGAANERWVVTHRGAGQYSIVSSSNNHAWSSFYDGNGDDVNLAAWGYDGNADRKFLLVPTDNGFFRILVVDGGLAVQTEGASLAAGAGTEMWEYSGAVAQQFAILAPAAPLFPTGLAAAWGESNDIPGDYDSNGVVTGNDFLAWQRTLGATIAAGSGADGDSSGVVDAADLHLWRYAHGLTADAPWIQLAWSPVAGATSYSVKRSTTPGGPYVTIAAALPSPLYVDAAVTAGGAYYYVVTATSPGGESLPSGEVRPIAPRTQLKFDEASGTTALDSSGNGWNGTLVNGALRAPGQSGTAVDLDGTNDHVTLPTGVTAGLAQATLSGWYYIDALTNWNRLFDFGTSTSNYMFLSPRTGTTGSIRFAITTGSGEQTINGSSALPTGQWVHVAVTLGGGVGILYVNGAEVGRNSSMTLTPASLGSTNRNYLGRSQFSGDGYLNGRIDDFRIYDQALGAAEIAKLATPPAALEAAIVSTALAAVVAESEPGSAPAPSLAALPTNVIIAAASSADPTSVPRFAAAAGVRSDRPGAAFRIASGAPASLVRPALVVGASVPERRSHQPLERSRDAGSLRAALVDRALADLATLAAWRAAQAPN